MTLFQIIRFLFGWLIGWLILSIILFATKSKYHQAMLSCSKQTKGFGGVLMQASEQSPWSAGSTLTNTLECFYLNVMQWYNAWCVLWTWAEHGCDGVSCHSLTMLHKSQAALGTIAAGNVAFLSALNCSHTSRNFHTASRLGHRINLGSSWSVFPFHHR